MFSGAACAPRHSKKTAATASAQERKDRGVLKGRCIIKSIDALKKEVDATKACGHRAGEALIKHLLPKRLQRTVPSGVAGQTEGNRSSGANVTFLSLVLHRVIVWSKAEGSARADGCADGDICRCR
jgi:hypothetical protein